MIYQTEGIVVSRVLWELKICTKRINCSTKSINGKKKQPINTIEYEKKKRFLQPKTGKTELYEDSFTMSKNWVVIGN